MPVPCAICKHPDRGAIDQQLALQVVNVAAVARAFGVDAKTLRRHRIKHLPEFLVAFSAGDDLPAPRTMNAEVKRLYLTTLDALARAEAGTLVQVGVTDAGPVYDRIWSPTAVARLIGEARKSLGVISALAADVQANVPTESKSAELQASFARALDRFAASQDGQHDALEHGVIDAVLVDDTPSTPTTSTPLIELTSTVSNEQAIAESNESPPDPYAGVAANGGGGVLAPLEGDPNLDALSEKYEPPSHPSSTKKEDPTDPQKRAAEMYLAQLPLDVRRHIAEIIDQAASNDQLNPETLRRPWPGNPGASREERAAEGFADPQPLQPKPLLPLVSPSTTPASDRTSRRPTHRPVDQSHDPNLPTRLPRKA